MRHLWDIWDNSESRNIMGHFWDIWDIPAIEARETDKALREILEKIGV